MLFTQNIISDWSKASLAKLWRVSYYTAGSWSIVNWDLLLPSNTRLHIRYNLKEFHSCTFLVQNRSAISCESASMIEGQHPTLSAVSTPSLAASATSYIYYLHPKLGRLHSRWYHFGSRISNHSIQISSNLLNHNWCIHIYLKTTCWRGVALRYLH